MIAATVYDFYDIGSSGIVNFNPWTNANHNAIFPVSGYYIELKVFLEGPYTGTGMGTNLNPDNIPLSQPFNTAPWNYTGTESVISIPNTNIVDWCLFELRDAPDADSATSGTMIAQQAAFLMNDGSIVDLNGSIIPLHTASITNNLFMVISHRNHLCIMSANPLTESGGIYSYDYTIPADQAYGINAQKDLGTGAFGLYGGDVNADGLIDMLDQNEWKLQSGTSGYLSGDINLDAQANNPDKNDISLGNNGQANQIPQ